MISAKEARAIMDSQKLMGEIDKEMRRLDECVRYELSLGNTYVHIQYTESHPLLLHLEVLMDECKRLGYRVETHTTLYDDLVTIKEVIVTLRW